MNVGAGTYDEALNISKSVDIEGAGAGQTIIQPTTLLSTGVGHKYDSNVQTAVYVHDTDGVTLNGLTIDANNLGANAVVFWNNASGTISNSLIENPMTTLAASRLGLDFQPSLALKMRRLTPPFSVNLKALDNRFFRIWFNR